MRSLSNARYEFAIVRASEEYAAVAALYGERRAERSGVPLIRHIDEGLAVMTGLDANVGREAMRAYCLHPLFQNDAELKTAGVAYVAPSRHRHWPLPVMLAMEYRHRANAWLSDKVSGQRWTDSDGTVIVNDLPSLLGLPDPGPLEEVKHMLIADKVQNRKDFLRYHLGTHKRSEELDVYFKVWLKMLGVDEGTYQRLLEHAALVLED